MVEKIMDNESIMSCILDSIPYPIVFEDCNHIIRYMNKSAKYHYYTERGYKDLIGKENTIYYQMLL